MALSGTISNAYKGWTYRIDWSATQSIENNTSTITCVHKLVCGTSYDLYISARDNKCTVDGVSQTFRSPAISTAGGTTITLGTTKHTVAHNDNGSKSCAVNGYFYVRATLAGVYKEYFSVSGTIILDTIARASQPSLITYPDSTQNVGYFGDTISIHMNRKSSAFTHKVRYAFGSLSGTCVDADTGKAVTAVATGFRWKIPEEFMDKIPNSTSGSGTIYVDTYNGSTLVGTKYSGFTAKVPSSVKPSCSCDLEDITGNDNTYGSPVQGLSKIKAIISATTAHSSPIKSYSISIDGIKYPASEATTGLLVNAGTSKVMATVTDGRGRSGSWSYDMTVQAYTPPMVNKLSVIRCNEDGSENDQGEFVKVTMGAKITPLGNKNAANFYCWYKKTSETEYTQGIGEIGLPGMTNYSPDNLSFIFEADGNSTYDIKASAADRHNEHTRITSVSTAFTLMNWNANGNGMGIGKVSEKENTLEIALDIDIDKDANIQSLFDRIYPVGSIYLAYNHVNPGTLFGGTWERIQNAFLWAVDSSGIIGQTGGEKTHTLTTSELPTHHHSVSVANTASGTLEASNKVRYNSTATSYNGTVYTGDVGAGQPHNNMPPYIQVSAWRRTA